MIGLIFQLGPEIVEVRVDKTNILFRNNQSNGMFTTIEGLKLNRVGVIREHPDLEGERGWQEIARNRFKEHIKSMDSEIERAKYVIKDLKKYGYKPKYMQRQGFRVEKIK